MMRVFLKNQKVILRPLEVEDLEGTYPSWFDSGEVCIGNNHHRFPYTRSELEHYIRNSIGTQGQLVLAIVDPETQEHVGNVALANIDWINRNANLTIIIGIPGTWNKGYGYNACRLMIDHAFNELQLVRIAMGTFETNIGMRRIGEKLGFVEEGIRRKAVFKQGKYVDVVEYGLLRDEYVENEGR